MPLIRFGERLDKMDQRQIIMVELFLVDRKKIKSILKKIVMVYETIVIETANRLIY